MWLVANGAGAEYIHTHTHTESLSHIPYACMDRDGGPRTAERDGMARRESPEGLRVEQWTGAFTKSRTKARTAGQGMGHAAHAGREIG